MMRILVLAATYPPTRCGVGDYTRKLAGEMARRGHEIFVLTGAEEDPDHQEEIQVPEFIEDPPVESKRPESLNLHRQDNGVFLAREVPSWDWACRPWILAALEEIRPDGLFIQYHGEDYLLHPAITTIARFATSAGIPVVSTLHNLQDPCSWREDEDPLGTLLRESDAWICTNTIDRHALQERTGPSEKLNVIATGPCIMSPARERRKDIEGPFRIAYFGFLNPFKGIEYLLRAVALLRDEGLDIRLDLAAGIHTDAPGRLRDYARFIQREIQKLEMQPLLHVRGYVEDDEISRLLLDSELAVFPFREGLSAKSTSFWSALHHGIPTLSTQGEGLPEGLAHGENVLLSGIDDAADLASRIRWAIQNRESLPGIGEAGRQLVCSMFSWEKLAGQTLGIFEGMLARSERKAEQ